MSKNDNAVFLDSLVLESNGGMQVVIVAKRGSINDWAAYMGAHYGPYREESRDDILQEVAAFGIKLSEEQARTWFGGITLSYRR